VSNGRVSRQSKATGQVASPYVAARVLKAISDDSVSARGTTKINSNFGCVSNTSPHAIGGSLPVEGRTNAGDRRTTSDTRGDEGVDGEANLLGGRVGEGLPVGTRVGSERTASNVGGSNIAGLKTEIATSNEERVSNSEEVIHGAQGLAQSDVTLRSHIILKNVASNKNEKDVAVGRVEDNLLGDRGIGGNRKLNPTARCKTVRIR
jgi:hypothetical protein